MRGRGPAGDLAHGVVGALLPLVWRARVSGLGHLPATGPVLLAANHAGLLDGPLVWGLLPRDVRFLVRGESFTGVLGGLLRATRQVPVARGTSRGGAAALLEAARVLTAGGAVGVFPEGTRGRGEVAHLLPGVAWLALRSGAPVVPVAVVGTARPGRSGAAALPPLRAPLHVALAPPVHLSAAEGPGVPRRASLALATEQLREVLAAHLRATAGPPARPARPAPAPADHPHEARAGDRR